MKDKLLQLFPEIGLIGNASLQKNVIDTYIAALEQGNWKVKELCELPFTLDFPEFIFSYADHVHGVTQISAEAAKAFNRTYASNKKYQVNVDLTIAGALLHDVGKLLEYERSKTVTSGKPLTVRHFVIRFRERFLPMPAAAHKSFVT